MKFEKYSAQTDILILLIGTVLVFSSEVFLGKVFNHLSWSQIARGILTSIGTGVGAAALTSLIIRMSHRESTPSAHMSIREKGKSPFKGDYCEHQVTASEVDCLSIMNFALLESLAEKTCPRTWKAILNGNIKMRILFVDTRSYYWLGNRLQELGKRDAKVWRDRANTSVELSHRIYNELLREHEKRYPSGESNGVPLRTGRQSAYFEIRVTNHPPNIWLYRNDDEILWGIIPSHKETMDARVFHLSKETEPDAFEELMKHFERLWILGTFDFTGDQSSLLKYSFVGELPEFNQDLYDSLKNREKSEAVWLSKQPTHINTRLEN